MGAQPPRIATEAKPLPPQLVHTELRDEQESGVPLDSSSDQSRYIRLYASHRDNNILPDSAATQPQSRRAGKLSRTASGAVSVRVRPDEWTPAYLAEQQAYDSEIGPVLAWIEGGHRPNWNEVKSKSPALRSLRQQ